MSVSAQTFSDIFNDVVKDNVKRATDVAALYNAGVAEKAAYREFRREWDKAVESHREGIRAQLNDPAITDLYKKLDRMLDGKNVDANAVSATLNDMAAKVAAETTAVGQFETERLRMAQTMSSIALAEGGMKRYPDFAKRMTRQVNGKLLDHDSLDRLERNAENHGDIYLDIAQRALEKITAQKAREAKRQEEIDRANAIRAPKTKSVTAPPTARFRRKPQVPA